MLSTVFWHSTDEVSVTGNAERERRSVGAPNAWGAGTVISTASLLVLACAAVMRPALSTLAVLLLMASALGAPAATPRRLLSAGTVGSMDQLPYQGVDPVAGRWSVPAPVVEEQLDLSPVEEAPAFNAVPALARPAASTSASNHPVAGTLPVSMPIQGVTASPPPLLFACPQTAAPVASTGGGLLLGTPWRVHVSPSQECYQAVLPTATMNKTTLRITYNLHGATALGADASAIILDQGNVDKCFNAPGCRWHFISLANYGTNGLDGQQTITIPLAAFPGLSPTQPLNGILHMRWWSQAPFTVDILSIVAS